MGAETHTILPQKSASLCEPMGVGVHLTFSIAANTRSQQQASSFSENHPLCRVMHCSMRHSCYNQLATIEQMAEMDVTAGKEDGRLLFGRTRLNDMKFARETPPAPISQIGEAKSTTSYSYPFILAHPAPFLLSLISALKLLQNSRPPTKPLDN